MAALFMKLLKTLRHISYHPSINVIPDGFLVFSLVTTLGVTAVLELLWAAFSMLALGVDAEEKGPNAGRGRPSSWEDSSKVSEDSPLISESSVSVEEAFSLSGKVSLDFYLLQKEDSEVSSKEERNFSPLAWLVITAERERSKENRRKLMVVFYVIQL